MAELRSRSSVATTTPEPCTIHALEPSDVATLASWLALPEIQAVLDDEPGGVQAARRRVKELVGNDPLRDGHCGYMIHFQDRPVGFLHVLSINWISRTCEIDIMVEPASQRSLIGVWVLAKTGEQCFDVLNLRKAYGYIFGNNVRSSRFFSRLMPTEATLVAGRRPVHGDENVLVVSLTAENYRTLRARYQWDSFIAGRITKS